MPVKNTCDCHNPPGGRVVCEPNQVAICIVQNGQARHECHNPPATEGAVVLVNWTLTQVTGDYRAHQAAIDSSDLQMLLAGTFDRDNGAIVTFALPESINTAVRTVAKLKGPGSAPPVAGASW